jgi:hypothetical protein
MKRDEYIDHALRMGYKISDIDRLTTYELSKLPASYKKKRPAAVTAAPYYGVTRPYYSSMPLYGGGGYRAVTSGGQSLTPSEEVALKKYFKGK